MVPFSPSSGSLAWREATRSPDGFSSNTCSTAQRAAECHRAIPTDPKHSICVFLHPSCTLPRAQPPIQDLSLHNMGKFAAKQTDRGPALPSPCAAQLNAAQQPWHMLQQ